MNVEALKARFEAEMAKIDRPGVDKLMTYIRKSDFYTAPASTKYHLSREGGLLQHSLNVLDALRGILCPRQVWTKDEAGNEQTSGPMWEYEVAGKVVATITEESLIVIALLHDICKTHFYATSMRNAKNEQTGKWEKVPYYTIKDRMPLGHGDKSVMIIKQFMDLETPEMYAIWWHMGFTGSPENNNSLGNAIEQYPIIWALHTADMMASRMMEDTAGNKEMFIVAGPAPQSAGEYADAPSTAGPVFEEALAYGD